MLVFRIGVCNKICSGVYTGGNEFLSIATIRLKFICVKLLETCPFLSRNNNVLLTNYCLVFGEPGWAPRPPPPPPPSGNFEGFLKGPRGGTGGFSFHMVGYMKEKMLSVIQIFLSNQCLHQSLG